jgi:hypothetical protein
MNKKDRIAFVKAGLEGYERLNDRSKTRTSKADWIALKLGCTVKQAMKYIQEALADAVVADVSPNKPVNALRKYEVTITREIEHRAVVEVEAENGDVAKQMAVNMADELGGYWMEDHVTSETFKVKEQS